MRQKAADCAPRRFDSPGARMAQKKPFLCSGMLAQYVGRLHREHRLRRNAGMLARLALKRQAEFSSLGYEIAAHQRVCRETTVVWQSRLF